MENRGYKFTSFVEKNAAYKERYLKFESKVHSWFCLIRVIEISANTKASDALGKSENLHISIYFSKIKALIMSKSEIKIETLSSKSISFL